MNRIQKYHCCILPESKIAKIKKKDSITSGPGCVASIFSDFPYRNVLYTDFLYTDVLYTDFLYTDVLYTDFLYTDFLYTDVLYTDFL